LSCPDDVDSDKMLIDTTSGRTCSNTHVVCSFTVYASTKATLLMSLNKESPAQTKAE